jgi:hypothetical protein
MALSILDGNQSATTLSTIVTSGQHIPAHTVVSLGTQAIANITSAISGTSVCIGSISISGTPSVTGSVSVLNFPASQSTTFGAVTGSVSVLNFPDSQSVTFGLVGGTVTANNFTLTNVLQYDGSHYFLKVGGVATTGGTSFPVYVAGSVTANPTGTQTIAGTVTAGNLPIYNESDTIADGNVVGSLVFDVNGKNAFGASGVTVGSLPALPTGTNRIGVVTIGGGTVTLGASTAQIGSVTASGTVTIGNNITLQGNLSNGLNVSILDGAGIPVYFRTSDGDTAGGDFPISGTVTIGSLPAISGTVTANSSNGSLTTRFGSVTTANTAFATSAVTNSSRKYLLIQNITTASNVITVGVGFTPTTTQGIQLTAGAGLTFEGSYIPTGAINLLSSVTASCFTILEA